MRVSNSGLELIKFFEGLRLNAYLCPGNVWTIVYGSTEISGRKVQPIDSITKEVAEELLLQDVRRFEKIVNERIYVTIKQNQFDALVSHAFNTGGSGTLFEMINSKSSDFAIRNWIETRYTTANGIPLQGLINRRRKEAEVYFALSY